jgi:hypothetical protein
MTGRDFSYTFASDIPAAARPWRHVRAALVAIAAVCVFGVSLVTREEVGTPSARARVAMPAPTRIWQLEARWWTGDIPQVRLQAATNSNTALTFAKGYQLRLAARQGVAASQVASSAETQLPNAAHKPTAVAHAEAVPLPKPRRVAVARIDPPTRVDYRAQTNLAFGEQRPSPSTFFASPSNPFASLFGRVN